MRKMTMKYNIHTELHGNRKTGEYFVQDRMVFESGREKIIPRFKGTEKEATQYAKKLATYWKKTLTKTPFV